MLRRARTLLRLKVPSRAILGLMQNQAAGTKLTLNPAKLGQKALPAAAATKVEQKDGQEEKQRQRC